MSSRPLKLLSGMVVLALVWLLFSPNDQREDGRERVNLADVLVGDDTNRFAQVVAGQPLEFPRDHSAHPAFRQEWWYFTGNLESDDGRQFGYQLTFFRFAATAHEALGRGSWNSSQTWMSHFAISDIGGKQFVASEDFARESIGLAGAEVSPFRVWTNGWSATEISASCETCFDLHLLAATSEFEIDLMLTTQSPPFLQGDAGYSEKSRDGSVASYYYSLADFRTAGLLRLKDETIKVRGQSWMDREWSSALLTDEQTGWAWFSIHLDNGDKVMLFQMRSDEKSAPDYTHGVLFNPGSHESSRSFQTIAFEPGSTWTSAASGKRYPVRWRIQADNLTLEIEAAQQDQEVDLLFTYYEGAIKVTGMLGDVSVRGQGYMELTGY